MSPQADGLATTTPFSHPASGLDALGKKPHLSRAQILDATEGCLAEEGYDGTTIRRIAKRLNCAVGSIYRYFTDKRELLGAVTQRRFDQVLTASEAGLELEQVHRMYVRVAEEQPEQYRLMFWLASVGRANGGRNLPPAVEKLIDLWADRLGDRRKAELAWAQLHGNLMLGRAVREAEPAAVAAPSPTAAAVHV